MQVRQSSRASLTPTPLGIEWFENAATMLNCKIPCTMKLKAIQKPRFSSLILLWVCLSQFPIPVMHSHADAAEDHRLGAHLDLKHACDEWDTECLHWHLLMPWDVAGDGEEESRQPASSPLGVWGAEGTVMIQSALVDDGIPVSLDVPFDVVSECSHALRVRPYVPAGNFLKTYSGVPVCALLCVSQR